MSQRNNHLLHTHILEIGKTALETVNNTRQKWVSRLFLTLVPATVFCDVRRQLQGGVFLPPPRHISNSRAHSNKISTAIPIFSVSFISMVQLPVSLDVNIRHKSNMAAAKVKCTYFTAVWLTEDNFKYRYPVGDFQCSRYRCADHGMPLMTDVAKPRWRLKREVVLTSARNKISAGVQRLCTCVVG